VDGGSRVVAKQRQDDWWMNHSISNVLEVLMESIWTGVRKNAERIIIKKKEKMEKAAKLKSNWWTT
jgi:hypothetical protein